MPDTKITVIAGDDHVIFYEGLVRLFADNPEIDFVGSTDNGDELIAMIAGNKPDIALMDVSMPGPGAEELTRLVTQQHPRTRLIALTVHTEAYMASVLLELGIAGYVIKNSAFRELIDAIHVVHDGDVYVSPQVEEEIARMNGSGRSRSLSQREREVLGAAAQGETGTLIAHELGISERTVDFHMSNILRKLSARHRTEAVAKAVKLGLITI